jgi:hypothetical protein
MGLVEDKTFNGKTKYVDNSAGQRQGAIGHYASRIVSSFIVAGHVQTVEDAVIKFHVLVEGIESGFGK